MPGTTKNKVIAIDSMIMIYLLEQHPKYWKKVSQLLDEAKMIVFSSFLYGEVLAGFYRSNEREKINPFLKFTQVSPRIQVLDFDIPISLRFARLRGKYKTLSAPDSIHLATAIEAKVDAFLTNDRKLPRLKEEVQILQLDAL